MIPTVCPLFDPHPKWAVAFRCRRRDLILVGVLSTTENQIAAKKPHENEEIRRKIDGFQLSFTKKLFSLTLLYSICVRGFCSALNATSHFIPDSSPRREYRFSQ